MKVCYSEHRKLYDKCLKEDRRGTESIPYSVGNFSGGNFDEFGESL